LVDFRVTADPGKQGKDGARIPLQVQGEDRVLFSKYAGSEVKIDGIEHIIMREDDILGILSE
jgi:chaperonin GroES